MSFLRPLRPLTASLLGFSLPSSSRHTSTSASVSTCTRYLWRHPSPAATRESPFPLVFIRARDAASSSGTGLSPAPSSASAPGSGPGGEEATWADWSGMFAEKGYTGIEIDITPPPLTSASTSDLSSSQPQSSDSEGGAGNVLESMTTMLASQIRLMAIPFAPIIISSGPRSTSLAQSYISSHPASGLVLVNPPADNGGEGEDGGGGGGASQFNYEPRFPILVVTDTGNYGGRLGKAAEAGVGRGGKGVEVKQSVDGDRGERTRVVVERWMDRCGF